MAECTIYDKLRYIAETKDLIKMAIESQDVEVLESATFRQYAEYITEIRKVSSINGMQGDVVLTIGDLDGYTKEEIDNLLKDVDVDLSDYYTKEEIDGKGYITGVDLSNYATLDFVGQEIEEVTDMFDGYYTKGEVDNAIENIDVTDKLGDYYTKQEIEDKGYLQAIPDTYITEDELSDELKDKVSETALNEALKAKQDVLTEGTGIKIEENVISLDYSYDLVEVVKELPTENIDENKIYLVKAETGNTYTPTYSVSGDMSPQDAITYEDYDVYEFNGSITVQGTTVTSSNRTRITFSGYETFSFVAGMRGVSIASANNQLFYGIGKLNEDLSSGKLNDTSGYAYYYSKPTTTNIDWYSGNIFENLDPEAEYFIDIWTNGGSATVMGMALSAPVYLAIPPYVEEEGNGNVFVEYIYVEGEWEEVGKVTAEVNMTDYYTKSQVDNIFLNYDKEVKATYATKSIYGDIDLLSAQILEVAEWASNKQDALVSGENIKTINGESILGEGDIVIQGGGGSVDMDGYLRQETLTQEEYDALATVEEDVLYVIEDAPEVEAPTKVSQLENDKKYVTENDLSNMDLGTTYTAGAGIKITNDVIELDTVSEVSTTNNTATLWKKEGTNSKISMFIINGSDTIKLSVNNTNSSPILNVSDKVALKTDIPDVSTKQDVLVSGTNIKTINGNSLLGSGNITIEGGSGEGASVIELTQAEFDALENKDQGFYLITDAQPNEYYTKSEIDALIGGVEDKITEINNMI